MTVCGQSSALAYEVRPASVALVDSYQQPLSRFIPYLSPPPFSYLLPQAKDLELATAV